MVLAVAGLGVLLQVTPAAADTGYEAATRVEAGASPATSVVDISSTAATAILSASRNRPAGTCQNLSSFNVYVGSAAATTTLASIGYLLRPGAEFSFGANTGALYAINSAGNNTTNEIGCIWGVAQGTP